MYIMTQLTNPLATAAQLYDRSSLSSLPQELIEGLFIHTQCLTQTAGLLLELPQSVTAQANVLLARYWVLESVMADELSVSPSQQDSMATDDLRISLLRPSTSLPKWGPCHGHHET